MTSMPPQEHVADLTALDAAAASAREGFACMFSTSDEYESALVTARRAEGRYGKPFDWQALLLTGCVFTLSGVLLMFL
ncbi:MAG: hypothetical protein J0I29_11055 [Rhizobiales bacterium]|nr:hypothetical protein [Hyphomicrobiales bacterium]